jgi:NAD(P)-dependent dehydrogenase (short-subunit alcohol dehydrogenase family)
VRLEEKVVVVTGAGSGLGRESSLLFAAEGATVVVTDVNGSRAETVAAEIAARGGRAIPCTVDVTKEEDVERAVAAARDEYGRLDVMFANAGVNEVGGGTIPFEDIELSDYRQVVDVVMTAVFLSFKHAIRQMKAQGPGGSIVATLSGAALHGSAGYFCYTAGKTGALGLVRAAAMAGAEYGIRVNALAPYHGMSPNLWLPTNAAVIGRSYEECEAWVPDNRAMPLRLERCPSLRDNANVALFLASDESAYISGVVIPSCNGGTTIKLPMLMPSDRILGGENVGVLPPNFPATLIAMAEAAASAAV